VRIFPDCTPRGIAAAKEYHCAWDATKKEWFLDITGTDTLAAWHLDRLVPPPEHVLRVSFDEREKAKRCGCRWNYPSVSTFVEFKRIRSPATHFPQVRQCGRGALALRVCQEEG
jgi:hypothetical protein